MVDTLTKRQADLGTLFVPCIFGNGRDDDTRGLVALFKNEAVMADDRVYEPGEDVTLYGLHLLFDASVTSQIIALNWRRIHIVGCSLEPYNSANPDNKHV